MSWINLRGATEGALMVGLVFGAGGLAQAQEPRVLVQLAVEEGTQVKAGQVIGKIDDSEPQMKKMAASADYAGAWNRWNDDVERRAGSRYRSAFHAAKSHQIVVGAGTESATDDPDEGTPPPR